MKKLTIEDLIEKISDLEKRVEALENSRPRASHGGSAGFAGTSFSEGSEEMTLVVLADGRAWKSGKGYFYFSKKDGTEDDCGSVGISVDKTGGEPLRKGAKIRITTSKVSADTYNGGNRFQCFADTCELLDGGNEESEPSSQGNGGTINEDPNSDPNDIDEDVPF